MESERKFREKKKEIDGYFFGLLLSNNKLRCAVIVHFIIDRRTDLN